MPAEVSVFRADELVQPRDADPPGDRDVARVVPRVVDPEVPEAAAEQAPDVVRDLREVVARVRLAVDAVQHPAAVGVNQAFDELLGLGVDDPLLPWSEHDPALVLAP